MRQVVTIKFLKVLTRIGIDLEILIGALLKRCPRLLHLPLVSQQQPPLLHLHSLLHPTNANHALRLLLSCVGSSRRRLGRLSGGLNLVCAAGCAGLLLLGSGEQVLVLAAGHLAVVCRLSHRAGGHVRADRLHGHAGRLLLDRRRDVGLGGGCQGCDRGLDRGCCQRFPGTR